MLLVQQVRVVLQVPQVLQMQMLLEPMLVFVVYLQMVRLEPLEPMALAVKRMRLVVTVLLVHLAQVWQDVTVLVLLRVRRAVHIDKAQILVA